MQYSTESIYMEKIYLGTLHLYCLKQWKAYLSVVRLEKEIQDLEKAELQISTNEEEILKKLKSVERTTEDIIRVSINISNYELLPEWVHK